MARSIGFSVSIGSPRHTPRRWPSVHARTTSGRCRRSAISSPRRETVSVIASSKPSPHARQISFTDILQCRHEGAEATAHRREADHSLPQGMARRAPTLPGRVPQGHPESVGGRHNGDQGQAEKTRRNARTGLHLRVGLYRGGPSRGRGRRRDLLRVATAAGERHCRPHQVERLPQPKADDPGRAPQDRRDRRPSARRMSCPMACW